MNILIINQPVGNRGDESAHRALVRQLVSSCPSDIITVVFFGESKENTAPIQVDASNLEYVTIPFRKGVMRLAMMAFKYHLVRLLVNLVPAYHKVDNYIKKSDKVICAPGGICLGRFMNWNHLLWLSRVQQLGKPLAYYSRSFGPFGCGTEYKNLFKRESLKVLKKMDFISIRDNKTMKLAEDIGIDYIPSIDTAFLEVPLVDVSSLHKIITNNYVVFVPNSLVWQPAFSKASIESINDFYISIIKSINNKYSNCKIVMMPQLYGQGERNDELYFKSLCSLSQTNNIVVLPDIYSSDVQQSIIRGSQLVIGARYHSIVFAINNERPFVSLSYEHKMFGLLSILGLDDRQVDITKIGTADFSNKTAIELIESIMGKSIDAPSFQHKAHSIAVNCYVKFINWLR